MRLCYSGIFAFICFISKVQANCVVTGFIFAPGPCTYQVEAVLQLYKTNQFLEVADPLPVIERETYLNLKASMIDNSRGARNLLVETCWATQQNDSGIADNTFVDFPGCQPPKYKSITIIRNNSLARDVFIIFPTFDLFPNEPQFYLHCTVGACDDCLDNECESLLPARTYTRSAAIVSLGPVKRNIATTSATSTQSPALLDDNALRIVAIVLGVIILLLIILIIACMVYPRCEKAHMKRRDVKGFDNPVLTATKHYYNTAASITRMSHPHLGFIESKSDTLGSTMHENGGDDDSDSATSGGKTSETSSGEGSSIYSTVVKKKPPQETSKV